MVVMLTYDQWKAILDRTKFATATSDGSAANFFSNDVTEGRVRYPWSLVFSNTEAGGNFFSLSKVEEDDSTTTIINNFNLAQDETVVIGLEGLTVVLPSLEGGTNLEINADADGVEGTVFYFDNEV